jgi:3-dehydro-4-phosphotetronate decarboxylase
MMNEIKARTQLVRYARSLYERGYATGSGGNISVLLDDGTLLATPTGSSFGYLMETEISHLDAQGLLLSGNAPTKEIYFHLALYAIHATARAVVHLHSTFATLLASCDNLEEGVPIKPFTPYFVMKVGKVGIIPYRKPGDIIIADDIYGKPEYKTFLMANHGLVLCGDSLAQAVYAAEEFEETAKLWYLGAALPLRYLSGDEIAALTP